ncbi:SusC/RagA family TonB-linked outer membrane protein [Pedobacter sp. BAL39]|uniref:SusC/RagA family TonB-linked outer membrane protein n=1 Tax=Pedobacter sp. BAL39 TaxID=391596 RepID=UPI0012FCBEB9|nr:SusC/RagA family TonB-linked outer membrane protein [Pedobacter sp. BAL39]
MKLTFIMIICLSLQSMANVYSQTKISLRMESVALKKALAAIEEKSDFYFVYSEQKAISQLKVSINSNEEPVLEVLKKMLLNTGYTFEPMANNLIIIKPVGAQQTVSGVITDETNQPMPGVSVKVKGTTRAVITNAKGAYSIQAATNEVLVINYIGYEPVEETVGSRSTINISLVTSNQGLNEVVVVGYGTQQKREVTNAVSQIKGSDIRKSSAPAITNSLAGRVPGLVVNQRNGEPGRDEASVLIRGLSTTGDSNPLIVIDGVANRDGISRIDPNDIETFTVLKDASAGIYGAQAANGVILITTRRGKTGASQFNYSFNQGYVSPTRLVKMADAGLYATIVNDINLQSGTAPSFSPEQISQYNSGQLPSTNWQEEILRNHSLQSRHSLTMDGGTENVKYFLSAGLSTQSGLLKKDETTGFKQYNFRSNIDAQASKRLKIGLDLAGRRENIDFLQVEQQLLFQGALIAAPNIPATINGLPTAGRQGYNPLAIAQGTGYDKEERNTLNGTLRYTYDIPGVEGLYLDGYAAYDYIQGFRKVWSQPWTYYEADANDVLAPKSFGPARALRQYFTRSNSLTLNSKINYKRAFGKHDVAGFLAYEQNEGRQDLFDAQRTGFVSSQIDQLFAGSLGNMTNYGEAFQTARQNYFGRFSYAYDSKYLLQVHFRYDGSQIFPSGERFGLFPGVSLGWVMSEEAFLKDNPVISNLKLRASWGKSGNDRIDPFQFLNKFTYGNGGYVFGGQDFQALNPGVAANPNITWENQVSRDIGFEAGFFQNKLTMEVDAFFNKRTKIQAPRNITVPQYTGLLLPDENIGKVDTKGIEASLTYNGNWNEMKYNIGGNFSFARSKVIFIDEGNTYPEAYQKLEGKPLGSPLLYNVIGIYQNEADLANFPGLSGVKIGDYIYADTNGDGVLNSNDQIRVPLSNVPQIQFGLNLGVSYKGFDLSALIQGQAKARQYMDYTVSLGNNGPDYFLSNAWRPDATGNELARAGRSLLGQNNTSFYHDVSFVRLKNLELGYTLPKPLLAKIGVKALRFYTNGYNLLTFDGLKKKGLTDPENANEKGWRYPLTKSINFGANLTF